MQFQENYSLKLHNSFGIDVRARYFALFNSVENLNALAEYAFPGHIVQPDLVLGGGSNILLTKNLPGWVFHNQIKGIKLEAESEDEFTVGVGAGENWHGFVQYCIGQGWAGLENLSLIPGSVGAAPMQNIGAYGVELKDCFYDLQAWHRGERKIERFDAADCAFGYRESVFKRKWKDQFIITKVRFRLKRKPEFHISYGAIQQELEKMGVQQLSIRAVADAVIRIRESKLPDPRKTGNAGSFFKNPSVSEATYQKIKGAFPEVVAYANTDGSYKLAAGWLIEKCGWKGYREGDAGCHAQQALVLVNYGNATGREILALAQRISVSVSEKFGVELEREVNVT